MDDATDARELAAQYLETARLLVSQFGERAEEYATQCSRSAETQEEWGEAVVWLKLRDAAFRLGTQSGGVARHRLH